MKKLYEYQKKEQELLTELAKTIYEADLTWLSKIGVLESLISVCKEQIKEEDD